MSHNSETSDKETRGISDDNLGIIFHYFFIKSYVEGTQCLRRFKMVPTTYTCEPPQNKTDKMTVHPAMTQWVAKDLSLRRL